MCGSLKLNPVEGQRYKLTKQLHAPHNLNTICKQVTGYPFGGFMRYENLPNVWSKRAISRHTVLVDGFTEHNQMFNRRGHIVMYVVDDPVVNGKTTRIVTVPSTGGVRMKHKVSPRDPAIAKIHDRMPYMEEMDK